MNIEEAITRAPTVPRDMVLVAKPPFTWGSESEFIRLNEDFRLPQTVVEAGFQYLLGVEDVCMLLGLAAKRSMRNRAIAELVLHYALTDCLPAWFEDIPLRERE